MKIVSLFLDNPQLELRVQVADNFLQRLRGLMLRSPASLPLGMGLLIAPCNSIHMMFMRFAMMTVLSWRKLLLVMQHWQSTLALTPTKALSRKLRYILH